MKALEGTFQLWDYSPAHQQMLIRRPKSEGYARNLDVAFVGVEYVECPTMLTDLIVCRADGEERAELEERMGRSVPEQQAFALRTGGRSYLVAAAAVKVFENELDLFESSLERF